MCKYYFLIACIFQIIHSHESAAQCSTTIIPVHVSCFNACNGSATANPSGQAPFSYSWNTVPVQTTQTATGLCAGSYTVTVTDNNSCVATASVTITQPSQLNCGLTMVPENPSCNGSLTAVVAGGTPAYSYLWSPGGQTTSTATGLCAGSYTVTITDANGCTTQCSGTVTTALQVTANCNAASCFGANDGSAMANTTGGSPPYTYAWSPVGQTTQTATGLSAGCYTVFVTDAIGNNASASCCVTQPPAININPSTMNVSCFGACNGAVNTSVTGGCGGPYTYLWMPGNFTTASLSNLCAGTYTLTVTDACACTTNTMITITEPPQLTANASCTPASCFGATDGTVSASVTGGVGPYTYSWSPGGQTSASVSGLAAGCHIVFVTDANGCAVNNSCCITQPAQLNANMSCTNTTCFGAADGSASVSASGGTLPYSYFWSPSGQTNATATGIGASCYTVTVTDASGCTVSGSCCVAEPPQLTVNVTTTPASCSSCCDGSSGASASGGSPAYTYLWTPGNITSPSLTGQCTGTYTVCVTDANGCTVCDTAVINFTVGMSEIQEDAILISPNPTPGKIRIQAGFIPEAGTFIEIYNRLGELVYKSPLDEIESEIDLSHQPKGIYFVNLTGSQIIAGKKILIQ
ncbi:MAG: T9SS type A sorting domain-containing protein [Bacteroidota bacterium]